MKLKDLSSDGKVAYLIKPILKVLQESGGQLERSEIRDRIADLDDQIAEYSELEKRSKKTGNKYKEFNFKFNFAIKDLYFNELLTYTNSSPVTLTEKGLYLDLETLDVQKDIIEKSIGKNSVQIIRKIKRLMLVTVKKRHSQKKKYTMILRKLCLLLYLKCHQENLKFFQERC